MQASYDARRLQEELEELGDAMICEVTLEDSVDETYGDEVLARQSTGRLDDNRVPYYYSNSAELFGIISSEFRVTRKVLSDYRGTSIRV